MHCATKTTRASVGPSASRHRLYAVDAPFEFKDGLKFAGYRWCAARRAWWIEADPERIANEEVWLTELHPRIKPWVRESDWFDRHKA